MKRPRPMKRQNHGVGSMATLVLALLGSGTFNFAWTSTAAAWDPFVSRNRAVEAGNQRLQKRDAKGALEEYDKAVRQLPSAPGVHLNRGLALLAQGKPERARESFLLATEPPADAKLRAEAYYNLGLSFYRQGDEQARQAAAAGSPGAGNPGGNTADAGNAQALQQSRQLFQESVDAFRRSLQAKPGNPNAAWNLELAQRRVRQQQEAEKRQQEQQKKDQESQDKKQDQQKDNKDPQQDPKKDDSQQDQKKPDQPKDPQGKQDSAPQQPGKDQQQPQPQDGKDQPGKDDQGPDGQASKSALPEDTQRLLDALQRNESSLEKHRAQSRARQENRRPVKDW